MARMRRTSASSALYTSWSERALHGASRPRAGLDRAAATCYKVGRLKRMGTSASTAGDSAALGPVHRSYSYWRFS
jgi:hypothetical protein